MPLSSSAQQQLQQVQQRAQGTSSASSTAPQQPEQEFDYKTSPVNQKGEALPAGAKSWTPMGTPYFGPGLGGTLKRYAWTMMGSPTGQNDERWSRFLELTSKPQFWSDPTSREFRETAGEFTGGVFGTEKNQATAGADWNAVREANARLQQIGAQYRTPNGVNLNNMPAEVRAEYEELQELVKSKTGSAAEGATSIGGISLLAPLVRGSKVAVQATLDVLSEASVKFEQTLGAQQAMREYADEQGSALPDLAFDIEREKGRTEQEEAEFWSNPLAAIKSEEAQGIANLASRLLAPILTTWDAFRFVTAPGTLKEKQVAIEQGWDAGRILYSQTIKPTLLAEFKRRAAAGEDPQLLAMELQDPWAEAIGQSLLDPLNFIGAISKGIKAAGMLDDATDAVRGGELGDEAAELMTDAGRGMSGPLGETAAAERMGKFDEILTKNIDRVEKENLTADFNRAGSYSPTGLRVRETKKVQTVSNVVTSSIMRNGGTADDVADFFHLISRATSKDKATRLEAWDQLMSMSNRFGLGRYPFSDDVLETGVLLRNLMEDKELLPALRAAKGDLSELAKILQRKFEQAVEKQIPTYTQVKNLAQKFREGTDTSSEAARAAKTYEKIGNVNRALWDLHEGTVGRFKQAVNSFLGKFFFSQPGFVSRNASNNFMTMFVDQGFGGTAKSFYREGKYWSIADIEDDLRKYFGGNLPPAVSGMSLTQSENAGSIVTRANDWVEGAFAKRIYWKNFRDTMDKFMTPGVALPKREEFKALGLTDDAIDDFVHILQNEAYGDVEQAIVKYSEKFGENGLLDAWKRWSGAVTPEEMSGLREMGLAKEIDDIVNTAKTPQEIRKRFDKLRRELQNRANTAADNPVGVSRERKGFEFMEGIGKAEADGLLDVDGTNRLNIMIEQSERASDELMRAIGRARDTVTDPSMREQFSVMEEAFSSARRGAARQTSQQLTDTAWALTRKARKSTGAEIARLWDQSILGRRGPAPEGLTQQQFLDELWRSTREDVSNNWEVYFSEGFDRLTPLIDSLVEQFPELEGIFRKAQKASAELNVYRTAIYRDGKIFYQQPPRNIRELASRYGIATATAEGIPQDRQLLATINKYGGKKYKSLDEVPLEEAEAALEARRKGAMTAADAARVEKPKAGTTGLVPLDDDAPESVRGFMQAIEGDVSPEDIRKLSGHDEAREYLTRKIRETSDPALKKKYLNLREFIDDISGIDDVNNTKTKKALEVAKKYLKGDGAQTIQKAPEAVQPELAAQGVTMEEATQIPRGELPPEVSGRFEQEARRMMDELGSGTGPQVSAPRQGEGGEVVRIPSTNVDWYKELPKSLQNKKALNAALEKIIKDKGSDKGVNVERLKEMIIERFRYGVPRDGVPPDLKVLRQLGADDKILQEALDDYNDITRQELTLEEVLGGTPAQADEITQAADELTDATRPYYDDEGNLVNPTDELGEIRSPTPNPEVQIAPPYVDGSPPIPGQMWKENSDGITAALNKAEAHMIDNYGMQAIEKMDGSQLKALKKLMQGARGRITEGMAIADKIGKAWRDFALLPYGETKNFDLALSYAFPYQFWYSRSYANWMQRVATDPQVIAGYARIKETMSEVNKDSPEWWRYNVEIPAHFLGLPNEHPMSFNLEANIWPLYGLTGTDFNDPQKRQNWLTATVDDMGKMGPSIWAPVQWAIALGYKAQGEDELAQAWGGRIIPQTATVKALSSYFGQPVELDPGVQLFSGKGIMDFAAMDKYERNRVGRALTAMVQSGELTEEQAVEVARTQEGPAWDEAVKRATQLRAPGQISSYFLGVGMKARTDEDRITDEFYEKYYRLQNLNEAGLIGPEQYQQEWDGLRDQYPFMDALLLSRKAGPDRDRAYAYNVLGRIPPGQASEIYKLVGIDPKVAQEFYASKGDMKGWSEAEREKFIAATVDLGAMLAIPDYATKQDWNEARGAYKAVQEDMKTRFGADIQEKIDQFFSLADKEDREAFTRANPEVQQALQWQNEQVVGNDLLYEFYGGIQSLEKFHKGKVYDELEKKYGADIQEKFDEYYQMQVTDPKGAKAYYRLHPELRRYNEDKKKLMAQALRTIVEFGARLPDAPLPELTGNEPQSVAQQALQDYATQTTQPFEYWQAEMPEVSAILAQSWATGEEIPYAVTKNLDFMARNYGYESGEDLLQAILISMNRQ